MEEGFSLTGIKIVLPDQGMVIDQPQACIGLFPSEVRCTFSFVGLGSVLTSITSGAKADDCQGKKKQTAAYSCFCHAVLKMQERELFE